MCTRKTDGADSFLSLFSLVTFWNTIHALKLKSLMHFTPLGDGNDKLNTMFIIITACFLNMNNILTQRSMKNASQSVWEGPRALRVVETHQVSRLRHTPIWLTCIIRIYGANHASVIHCLCSMIILIAFLFILVWSPSNPYISRHQKHQLSN